MRRWCWPSRRGRRCTRATCCESFPHCCAAMRMGALPPSTPPEGCPKQCCRQSIGAGGASLQLGGVPGAIIPVCGLQGRRSAGLQPAYAQLGSPPERAPGRAVRACGHLRGTLALQRLLPACLRRRAALCVLLPPSEGGQTPPFPPPARRADVLDISSPLNDAAAAIVDDSFLRCFKVR